MEPVLGAAWKLGEPFLHRVFKEVYQRIGWIILRGDRTPRFPCTTVRYALAGPLSDYARSRLTPPSLLDAMMASAPPRLGPVLVCTPTLESVPMPPVTIDPTKTTHPETEGIATTDDWTDLLLFLAGAAVLIFIAHKVHQHRLANETRIDESDAQTAADPAAATVAATDSGDDAPTAADPAAATVAPVVSDTSDFWFAFFIVVMAILMG